MSEVERTPNLVSYTSVLGRAQLVPAIQDVDLPSSGRRCRVKHQFVKEVVLPKSRSKFPVEDCTTFTTEHFERGDLDLSTPDGADQLLEEALEAISEVLIWNKMQEKVGKVSSFMRQVGRPDVKMFSAMRLDGECVYVVNPLFRLDFEAYGQIANMMRMLTGRDMVMSNGVAANPTHPVIRRAMASLDLLNLGFYTEAFVNLFSLVDDLTQQVLKAGMAKKGIADEKQQNSILMAIKEERLRHFLTSVAKLCDWTSMAESDKELFDALMQVNVRRNKIMHGSFRQSRDQLIKDLDTLLSTVEWLAMNPFGHVIPHVPDLFVARGEFCIDAAPPPAAEEEPKKS